MAANPGTGRVEAKVVHRFKAAPERVYDAWLRPETVRIWLQAALRQGGLSGDLRTIEIDPRVGGRFVFSDMRDAGEARHWGTYLVLDRPREIVFTWITDKSEEANPSKVTLTIEKDGEGSIVTLTHEMDRKWTEYVSRTERGWARMLDAIGELLAQS
jgi:uncharacterized protein YndB with AHSA1/START domain